MEKQSVSASHRTGAALTLTAGILQLMIFFFVPAFEFLFKFSIFQALQTVDLFEYDSIFSIVMIALALIGSLVCIGLSILILVNPEKGNSAPLTFVLGAGYGIALLPYFFLLIFVVSDFGFDISFFAPVAYVLTTGVFIAGTVFLSAKSPAPAAAPVGPAAPYDPALSSDGGSTNAVTGLDPDQALILVRMNTQEHFPIMSTFPATILGRSSTDANIVVSGNSLVGRQHAQIDYQGGCFYITDLNSKNKTYLNDVCLQPNARYVLKKGDYITLANEVFAVNDIKNC